MLKRAYELCCPTSELRVFVSLVYNACERAKSSEKMYHPSSLKNNDENKIILEYWIKKHIGSVKFVIENAE